MILSAVIVTIAIAILIDLGIMASIAATIPVVQIIGATMVAFAVVYLCIEIIDYAINKYNKYSKNKSTKSQAAAAEPVAAEQQRAVEEAELAAAAAEPVAAEQQRAAEEAELAAAEKVVAELVQEVVEKAEESVAVAAADLVNEAAETGVSQGTALKAGAMLTTTADTPVAAAVAATKKPATEQPATEQPAIGAAEPAANQPAVDTPVAVADLVTNAIADDVELVTSDKPVAAPEIVALGTPVPVAAEDLIAATGAAEPVASGTPTAETGVSQGTALTAGAMLTAAVISYWAASICYDHRDEEYHPEIILPLLLAWMSELFNPTDPCENFPECHYRR